MPSGRVQRRIDRLLDQAEEAADKREWDAVRDYCDQVLRLEPGNADASSYLDAANRDTGVSLDTKRSSIAVEVPGGGDVQASDQPSSFASGRYTVSKFLGEGGKKRVYLAHDNTLDRDVAFALIKTEGLDETSRERVKREAQAMGRMGTHPCIMPIYDLGEETDANGVAQPFMVQPLMSGGDVEGLVEDAEGPLELDRALEIATQTAQGLSFAHSKGIIHRDLKPGNVWLDENGAAKIGDFGLAVATDRSRLTVEKVMVGTVSYMPPEQATGGEVTPRADLYSLGAMLYEMSTGRPPFLGDDDIAIVSQHVNTPPVAPSWHNSKIPKTLDSLVMRLLAKDPAERPESADEVLAALKSVDLSAVTEETDEESKGSLDAMAGGVFVGRHREMDQLKSVFEEVLSGKGRMLVLVGEPGIGKTRTAQELATYAGMRKATVVWGRSYESGGAPPYWPWVQAIRSYVSVTDPETLRNQMGTSAPVIAQIVPDVGEKLIGLATPTQIDDPDSARFRLFDSVTTFLKNVSQSSPLVLMLEDLHWSDKPSLMLLEFVARELANSRILIVGNYRDMELNRRHPLAVTLGDLTRERLFERIVLRGLQRHDVERFMEIAAGISPPSALVDTVHTQTEGNPLFVTETVRLLIQEGNISSGQNTKGSTTSWEIRIPEGVREVIGRRLDRLSERCNEVLTTSAVMGRQFRFPVLLKLSDDVTENMLLDVMDEALSARIIEELPEEVGLYQFTHALMQETLTSELSSNRKVRLHARIAEALEEHYGTEALAHAEEMAEHFSEAAIVLGPERASKYMVAAGNLLAGSYAYSEAVELFQGACDLLEPEGISELYINATYGLGRSLMASEQIPQRGVDLIDRAFTAALEIGDTPRALEIASTRFSTSAALTGRSSILKRALKLVPEGSVTEGYLLSEYGEHVYHETGDVQEATNATDRALEIGEAQHDDALLASALGHSVAVATHQSDTSRVVTQARRAVEVGLRAGNYHSVAQAAFHLATKGAALGYLEEAREAAATARDAATRIGLPWRIRGAKFAQYYLSFLAGQYESSGQDQFSDMASRLGGMFEALHSFRSGEFETASATVETMIARAEQFEADPFEILGGVIAASFLMRFEENPRYVELAIKRGSELIEAPTSTLLLQEATSAALGWIAVVQQDKKKAAEFAEYFETGHSLPLGSIETMNTGHLLANLHRVAGDYEKSIERFEHTAQFLRDCGYRPDLALVTADYSELLLDEGEPGDRKKAIELQDEAISIATELGMKPLLERVLARREILKA